ncbi:MAG: ABC transporter permease [Actinobacteria bacterium]|nr:ABC transporter permease [Actinomycetota bacterium]
MFVLTIGIGALVSAARASRYANHGFKSGFDPTRVSLTGLLFGQLAIGVLGVLVITAEHSTGTIRSTLSAIPRRPVVLAAKVVTLGFVALVVSEAVCFVAFFVGQAIIAASAPHATLSTPGALRSIVGGGLYLTVLALLALGLGTLIRHTAGAITAFVGILLILPLILQSLPSSYIAAIGKYLPANIGIAMMSPSTLPDSFSAWTGFALLSAYAAVALLVGGWTMVKRDA